MLPTQSDVHVNVPLTNISVAYMQDNANFIASQVFPNIPVGKQSDRYYTYDRGDFNRDEMEERAPATESAGSGYRIDNTPTYYCRKYAFHKDVPDEVKANEDLVLSSDRDATYFVSQKALLRRERIWASNFFATSKWTYEWAGKASSPSTNEFLQWNNGDSTPIEDVRTQKTTILEATGFEPNTLVLGQRVLDQLVDHPSIVDRVKYGQTPNGPAMVNMSALAALFQVDRILVMKAIYNSAKEGATASHSFIGGKHALLCYVTPTPGLLTPTAGYTFSWTGLLGASALGGRIKSWYMTEIEAERIEIEMAFDMKLIGADLGMFYKDAVA